MLIASVFAVGLRSYSLPVGFTAAFLHFVLSGWLWRDYVYGGAGPGSSSGPAPIEWVWWEVLALRALWRVECAGDELLARFSDWIEVYSIDEAFLGVQGTLDELQVLGEKIKSEVMRLAGLPVCGGIARTKHDSCGKRTKPVDPSLG